MDLWHEHRWHNPTFISSVYNMFNLMSRETLMCLWKETLVHSSVFELHEWRLWALECSLTTGTWVNKGLGTVRMEKNGLVWTYVAPRVGIWIAAPSPSSGIDQFVWIQTHDETTQTICSWDINCKRHSSQTGFLTEHHSSALMSSSVHLHFFNQISVCVNVV